MTDGQVVLRSPFTGEPFEVPPEFSNALLGALLKRGFELVEPKGDKPKKRKGDSTR